MERNQLRTACVYLGALLLTTNTELMKELHQALPAKARAKVLSDEDLVFQAAIETADEFYNKVLHYVINTYPGLEPEPLDSVVNYTINMPSAAPDLKTRLNEILRMLKEDAT